MDTATDYFSELSNEMRDIISLKPECRECKVCKLYGDLSIQYEDANFEILELEGIIDTITKRKEKLEEFILKLRRKSRHEVSNSV